MTVLRRMVLDFSHPFLSYKMSHCYRMGLFRYVFRISISIVHKAELLYHTPLFKIVPLNWHHEKSLTID